MLDRRSPHGIELLLLKYVTLGTANFLIIDNVWWSLKNNSNSIANMYWRNGLISLHILHEVDRVARGRHEALCQCAEEVGRDAEEGSGELGGQAPGGGVGQADGGGRAQGLQASSDN